jgi:hypothetical protein
VGCGIALGAVHVFVNQLIGDRNVKTVDLVCINVDLDLCQGGIILSLCIDKLGILGKIVITNVLLIAFRVKRGSRICSVAALTVDVFGSVELGPRCDVANAVSVVDGNEG